jgi:hypothetical protein
VGDRDAVIFFRGRGAVARSALEASRHGFRKLLRESGRKAEAGTVIAAPIRSMEMARDERRGPGGRRKARRFKQYSSITAHTSHR